MNIINGGISFDNTDDFGTVFVADSCKVESDITETLNNNLLVLNTVTDISLINEIIICQ